MSWCLRVQRIVCNLMNMCLSNLQIPTAVLGYKGSGSNGGARSCYGGFHTASKGCVKQDDGCCKGQRPQTVCHHHQSPRKLIVASLSTLSGQITSDALQEGSTFWKDGSSNQNVWSGMRKKKKNQIANYFRVHFHSRVWWVPNANHCLRFSANSSS